MNGLLGADDHACPILPEDRSLWVWSCAEFVVPSVMHYGIMPDGNEVHVERLYNKA
jgi:hypothetical protein